MNNKSKLVALIRKLGLIDKEVSDAVALQSSIGPIKALANAGYLDEIDTIEAISKDLGIDYFDLDDSEILTKVEEAKLIENLNLYELRDRIALPLYEENGNVIVAFANPIDHNAEEQIRFLIQKPVVRAIAEEVKIKSLIEHFISNLDIEDIGKENFDDSSSSDFEILATSSNFNDNSTGEINATPVIKLSQKLLIDSVEQNASDIHLEPMQNSVQVRLRIDGVMQDFIQFPKELQPYITSRYKLICNMDISEKRKPQDGRFSFRYQNKKINVRVSSIPTALGEKLVFRLLNNSAHMMQLDELGIPDNVCSRITTLLNKQEKMLLVTGPTGSGKTTTLYACLNHLNNGKRNIITIEDPIEYNLQGVNQIQTQKKINVTFASALRSILRQDPDVIMVGEVRDDETAGIAVQAAQTGHMVLSTVHTHNAISAFTRLNDLGIENFLISNSICGVLAQRLVRKLCSHCVRELNEVEQNNINTEYIPAENIHLLRTSEGCSHCNYNGYSGRLGLYSFVELGDDLSKAINAGKNETELQEVAAKSGYQTLGGCALDAVLSGKTSYNEAMPHLEIQEQNNAKVKASNKATLTPKVEKLDTISEQTQISSEVQKVLLIDDDVALRNMLGLLLSMKEYEVIHANNGEEGLEILRDKHPELVICDLHMPVMDGIEFVKEFRSQEKSDLPIIILTSQGNEENELELLKMGVQDFVSKQTNPDIMIERIIRAIR